MLFPYVFVLSSFLLGFTVAQEDSQTDSVEVIPVPDNTVRCLRHHEVTRGQVPMIIARDYGITTEQLLYLNPDLDVYSLQPGQNICVEANIYHELPRSPDSSAEDTYDTLNEGDDSDVVGVEESPITDALDLAVKICSSLYAVYGLESDLVLPEVCCDSLVRTRIDEASLRNPGFLNQTSYRHGRDGWLINCSIPFYCSRCREEVKAAMTTCPIRDQIRRCLDGAPQPCRMCSAERLLQRTACQSGQMSDIEKFSCGLACQCACPKAT